MFVLSERPSFSLILIGSLNVSPPSMLSAKKISLGDLNGDFQGTEWVNHVMKTFSPSTAIFEMEEKVSLSLIRRGSLNVFPPSSLFAKKISELSSD